MDALTEVQQCSTVTSTKNTTPLLTTELAGASVSLQRQPKSEKHAFLDAVPSSDHGVQQMNIYNTSHSMLCMYSPSFMRLSSSSSIGLLPFTKNALHSPTSSCIVHVHVAALHGLIE